MTPADGTPDLQSQLKSLNIIVIDDEPVARKVLERGLRKSGYECEHLQKGGCWDGRTDLFVGITCCSSPFEALDLIRNNTYHIALCDVLMPGMDGLALLTEIRKLPHAHEMSVISMSFIRFTPPLPSFGVTTNTELQWFLLRRISAPCTSV
jgi:CheY-like chemotaxis protein